MNPSDQKRNAKKLDRRGFIGDLSKITLVGALGASTPVSQAIAAPVSAAKFEFSTAPYLQNLTEQDVHIMFLTNQNAFSWVEYGEERLNQKAFAHSDGFIQANNQLNSVQLKGLKPGTKYQYRVVSKQIVKFDPYDLQYGEEIASQVFRFETRDPEAASVSCLILNDIHDRPHSFGHLLSLNKERPYEFVALNGDMFDYQTDERQIIDHLLKPCTNVFASEFPFLMIRGNHETRGKFARNFKDYFAYEDNEYYFSFKQGPVHWIVIDSGEDKEDNHPEYGHIVDFDRFRERQAEWLEKELQQKKFKNCKYRVVLMHIPPFHAGNWHGTMHCRQLFHPLFEKHKVDMVISGHTHRYGIHPPSQEHAYPIIIGGGPKEGNRTVIQFEANREFLIVNMIKDSGETVGTYRV
ncbi:purple acid phosphatase family protein [Sabulibacter ruber]|uniref:purple acid phosphatase family protein n=1 Tax=Sabulibacter ruber TaxID=2811901 RepID=UPI001A9785FB|nr:metallophosphoesterase family protein [Sabulibacter ruber]